MQSQTLTKCKNEIVMDFRDLMYRRYESEWYIQDIQGAKSWLKYLNDGYSQDPELDRIIELLNNYIDNQ